MIGAGASGLQSAATLLEHGFEVRLFDRQPKPGGNWFHTSVMGIPAAFPSVQLSFGVIRIIDGLNQKFLYRDRPAEFAAYTPDIRDLWPEVHIYEDGEDGISNEWRWREHWSPSPVWKNLHSNSAPVSICR